MNNIARLIIAYKINMFKATTWQRVTMQMRVQLKNNSTIQYEPSTMPTISGGQTRNLQSLSRQGINPALRQCKNKENHNIIINQPRNPCWKHATCDYNKTNHIWAFHTLNQHCCCYFSKAFNYFISHPAPHPKANSAALEKLTRQRAPLMVPIGE